MEWELDCWPGKHKENYHPLDRNNNRFQWTLEGEVELSLVLALNPKYSDALDYSKWDDPAQPCFEMARIFKHKEQVGFPMIDSALEMDWALKDIEEWGDYIQPFFVTAYLDEFEQFFREYLLPLPQNYKQAWGRLYLQKEISDLVN